MAWEQDFLNCDKELKQAKEELHNLNKQVHLAKDLRYKLDITSTLLANLKARFSSYKETNMQTNVDVEKGSQSDLQEVVVPTKKKLEEVELNIQKATT